MKRELLLTQGEVFKNEILAGSEGTNHPSEKVPKLHDHGRDLTERVKTGWSPTR